MRIEILGRKKKEYLAELKTQQKAGKVGEERFEQTVCRQKRDVLRDLPDAHELTVGIRPERLKIELYDSEKTYENGLIVTPTVSELLGGEYGIHFDFAGGNWSDRLALRSVLQPRTNSLSVFLLRISMCLIRLQVREFRDSRSVFFCV